MRLFFFPLLVVPLIIYNLVAFGLVGGDGAGWVVPMFSVSMVSGAVWTMNMGDLLVAFALVLLLIEVLKSTRTGNHSIADHMMSMLVFIAYLVEFLAVPAASTSLFFTCLLMSFVDLAAGFSVSIRAAGRDINLN